MERTDSIVVQVAPSYENEKIKEMGAFGWNLQGRQEMREEGEAYGRPSYVSSNTYIIKTKVHHYVKLHFVRSFSMPDLQAIRQLESEYFNLQFPPSRSLVWPIIFTLFPLPGGVGMLADPFGRAGSPGLLGLLIVGGWVFLGIRWIRSRRAQNEEAERIREASAKRAQEILAETDRLVV